MRRRAGGPTISAERRFEGSAEEIFDLLSDLENHWRLTGRDIEVVDLAGPAGARTGGTVRLRGLAGVGRSVRTEVIEATRPRELSGRARLGGGTEAIVRWMLRQEDGGVAVTLSAEVVSLAPADRLLLALGGASWLRRMFSRALARLERIEAEARAPAAARLR